MSNTKRPRDPRLDVFRGVALAMIFINHVPGNPLEHFTNRNFGFSDSAEGFVFMSGLAAGIAYSSAFRATPLGLSGFLYAAGRVWKRAWTLYMTHILTTVLAFAVVAGGFLWLDTADLLNKNVMKWVLLKPLETFWGMATLGHQFGYVNILPMYAMIMLGVPFALVIALRSVKLMLTLSAMIWLAAGIFRLNMDAYPLPGGWFFNPFAWQFLFMIGLAAGLRMREGKRLLPQSTLLMWLTGGYLLLSLLWMKVHVIGDALNHMMWMLQTYLHLPRMFTTFEKTLLAAPRLLHILSLAYFLAGLPWVMKACASRWALPFTLMGRQGLVVFAMGSVLCYVVQVIMAKGFNDPISATLLVLLGLALQLLVATIRNYWPKGPLAA